MKYQIKQIIHEELTKQQISKICEFMRVCAVNENTDQKTHLGTFRICKEAVEELNVILPAIKEYIIELGGVSESNKIILLPVIETEDDAFNFLKAILYVIRHMNEYVITVYHRKTIDRSERDFLEKYNTVVPNLNNFIRLITKIISEGKDNSACKQYAIYKEYAIHFFNGNIIFMSLDLSILTITEDNIFASSI